MSYYTVDLYFVGKDEDDALSSLPFTDFESAEIYRDDSIDDGLSIYEAEILFELPAARLEKIA